MNAAGQRGPVVSHSVAGRDITAVSLVVNVVQAVAALGGRVALAPPKLGDWGLVGRGPDLARLHALLCRYGETAVVPVAGLGGLGKTALALGYLARYGDQYELVAWIDAERPELIAAQYRRLVRHRTGSDVPEGDAVAAAKALLANEGAWLLVFDNAATPAAIHPFLPSGRGRVLVTTRNETWSAQRELIFEMDKLPLPVVEDWLARALSEPDTADLAQLAARLDGLPLAVVQALAYIAARPGETAATYLGKLEAKETQREVLSRAPSDYPLAVATTWALAAEELERDAPVTMELLRHLAFMSPDAVPLGILDGLLPEADAPSVLEALRRYGLVRYGNAASASGSLSGQVSLHRLVQDVTRWPLDAAQEAAYVANWAAWLLRIAPSADDRTAFGWFAALVRHVLALSDHALRQPGSALDVAVLANDTGFSLLEQAAFETARTVLERALRLMEASLGTDHPDVARTLTNLANALRELAQYEEAMEHYERALGLFRAAYGENTDVATVTGALAMVRAQLGRHDEAVELYGRALAITERVRGPDHPDVAFILRNLGISHQALHHYDEAIATYKRAMRIDEATYGPDDPRVAATLTNLGNVRRELGRPREAIALYDRALPVATAAYGEDHPTIAIILTNLGAAQRDVGRHREALATLLRALSVKEGAYGPVHPEVGITLLTLGRVEADLRRRRDAIASSRRARDIFVSFYGPDHPFTEKALEQLRSL